VVATHIFLLFVGVYCAFTGESIDGWDGAPFARSLRTIVPATLSHFQEVEMPPSTAPSPQSAVTREQLIQLLNDDLSREYQAIIAYVVYSQVLKGAAYMEIAKELAKHASEELQHALIISKQIDYLGGLPTVQPKEVKVSDKAEDMLRFDLDNEADTIRAYRERVRQCEALGEYAIAEHIRTILVQEQDHLIELATALGQEPPNMSERAK
jgi:bacterioferritin